jgi:hypothetical protein
MKKLILLPLLLLGVMVLSLSCKKESRETKIKSTPDETINVKIALNQSYQLDMTNDGTVSISRQANHFLVSEAIGNNENGTKGYKYIPATDFTGNDEVLLSSTRTVQNYSPGNSSGCSGSGNSNSYTTSVSTKYTMLKITVSN